MGQETSDGLAGTPERERANQSTGHSRSRAPGGPESRCGRCPDLCQPTSQGRRIGDQPADRHAGFVGFSIDVFSLSVFSRRMPTAHLSKRQRRHLGRAWAVAEAAIDEGRQNDHGTGQRRLGITPPPTPCKRGMLSESHTSCKIACKFCQWAGDEQPDFWSGVTGSDSVGVTTTSATLQPLTVADGTQRSGQQASSGLARPDLRVCADLPAGRRCYARASQSNRGSPLTVGARARATTSVQKLTLFALSGMVVG